MTAQLSSGTGSAFLAFGGDSRERLHHDLIGENYTSRSRTPRGLDAWKLQAEDTGDWWRDEGEARAQNEAVEQGEARNPIDGEAIQDQNEAERQRRWAEFLEDFDVGAWLQGLDLASGAVQGLVETALQAAGARHRPARDDRVARGGRRGDELTAGPPTSPSSSTSATSASSASGLARVAYVGRLTVSQQRVRRVRARPRQRLPEAQLRVGRGRARLVARGPRPLAPERAHGDVMETTSLFMGAARCRRWPGRCRARRPRSRSTGAPAGAGRCG